MRMLWKIQFWALFLVFGELNADSLPPPCDSQIYCKSGDTSLLHVVQMERLYNDSKTFVDKSIKTSPNEVLNKFSELMQKTGNSPNREQIQNFVETNFHDEGSEFEIWEPNDWNEHISMFDNISDVNYLNLAKDLHRRWRDLGRQIKSEVKNSPEKYSLIPLEHPFIVPGGRFREMYYWDSYWTIQGLLVSEMYETVLGMLKNFVQLVQDFGLVPNGNRIYYSKRSQPPLFIAMVQLYFEATNDKAFLQGNIDVLDKEFEYWIANRTTAIIVDGKEHLLAHYNVEVDDPRPESYYEDYKDAQEFSTLKEKQEFYQNMKSGAESGWDYSTKWFFKEDGSASLYLKDIQTRHIIPVELNSYLCRNAKIMEKFHTILGNSAKAQEYTTTFERFKNSIDEVLWNDTLGAYFDYKIVHNEQNTAFYPSNVAPLWANCFLESKNRENKVVEYIEDNDAFNYPGGIPTSLVKSDQQWDFSNAWAPLQELVVTGLENVKSDKSRNLARVLVEKWLKNVYASYIQSGKKMFEKYDVEQIGLPGGGGEYKVQEGFGWSNGVILHFMKSYNHMKSPDLSGANNVLVGNGFLLTFISLFYTTIMV